MHYKPLPDNPSLEFDKKRAKALLKAYRSGDDDAYTRIRNYHPRLLDKANVIIREYDFRLADAQLVIAREYGFPSWTKLKTRIQSLTNTLEPEIEQFKSAITNHDVSKVRDLLKQHKIVRESINDPLFSFGSVALTQVHDNREMLDLLLEYGADVNTKSNWWAGGFHVLHHVNPDVADYLIERGAEVDVHAAAEYDKFDRLKQLIVSDPELVNALGGDGKTPLHYASTIRVMDYLLSHGASINQRDIDHESTPLQWAIGNEVKCRYLIEQGADIDIFVACYLGDVELVKRAIQEHPNAMEARTNRDGYPPTPRAQGGHMYLYNLGGNLSPHQIAQKYGHTEVYNYLIQHSSPKVRFLDACERADEVTARKILDENSTIMSQLSDVDKQILPNCAWNNDIEAVRVLLNLGFDSHITSDDQSTALDRASFHGFVDIVSLLLEHDPNPPLDYKNEYGGTPLGTAIYGMTHSWRGEGDHYATIEALIKAGAKYDESWLPTGNDVVDELLSKWRN